MKRLVACVLSLLLCCGCALPVWAAEGELPQNNGGSEVMLVVAVAIVVFGGVYLFMKLKK